MGLVARYNQALEINPPAGDQFLNVNGSNWLWAVTAVYVFSFVIFWALSFKARHGEKIFHYVFVVGLLVGSICYYAMAADLAWSVVPQANAGGGSQTRQIFFAKYINWVVAFPVAILSLGLLSGVAWATMFFNVFLSWIWVISYLVAAYTRSNYKWGFFAFGTAAWIYLAISTLTDGLKSSKRLGVSRDYGLLAGWLNLLWLLYPIAWGLSDGGNYIGVVAMFIFFGILDVMMIPILAYAFLALSSKWDYGKLNLHFTQYGRVAQGGSFPEKHTTPPATGGAVVGEQAA